MSEVGGRSASLARKPPLPGRALTVAEDPCSEADDAGLRLHVAVVEHHAARRRVDEVLAHVQRGGRHRADPPGEREGPARAREHDQFRLRGDGASGHCRRDDRSRVGRRDGGRDVHADVVVELTEHRDCLAAVSQLAREVGAPDAHAAVVLIESFVLAPGDQRVVGDAAHAQPAGADEAVHLPVRLAQRLQRRRPCELALEPGRALCGHRDDAACDRCRDGGERDGGRPHAAFTSRRRRARGHRGD
jgi:hypothetical protein